MTKKIIPSDKPKWFYRNYEPQPDQSSRLRAKIQGILLTPIPNIPERIEMAGKFTDEILAETASIKEAEFELRYNPDYLDFQKGVEAGKKLCQARIEAMMKINRVWAMPSIWTFSVPHISELVNRYVGDGKDWADPFAGENSPAEITNDIEGRSAKYQLDALDFLKTLKDTSLNGVLFDPPYSVEQCLRRYTPKFKGTAGRAEYWARCKDEISRTIMLGGEALSFCWDSTGMGAKRGFEIIEILLVCHGACHNDTICTVEKKTSSPMILANRCKANPTSEVEG